MDAEGNKISVDDPDYWQKLMPQAAFRADPRILVMPRKRKSVTRYHPRDFDDDDDMTEDAGVDYDGEPTTHLRLTIDCMTPVLLLL